MPDTAETDCEPYTEVVSGHLVRNPLLQTISRDELAPSATPEGQLSVARESNASTFYPRLRRGLLPILQKIDDSGAGSRRIHVEPLAAIHPTCAEVDNPHCMQAMYEQELGLIWTREREVMMSILVDAINAYSTTKIAVVTKSLPSAKKIHDALLDNSIDCAPSQPNMRMTDARVVVGEVRTVTSGSADWLSRDLVFVVEAEKIAMDLSFSCGLSFPEFNARLFGFISKPVDQISKSQLNGLRSIFGFGDVDCRAVGLRTRRVAVDCITIGQRAEPTWDAQQIKKRLIHRGPIRTRLLAKEARRLRSENRKVLVLCDSMAQAERFAERLSDWRVVLPIGLASDVDITPRLRRSRQQTTDGSNVIATVDTLHGRYPFDPPDTIIWAGASGSAPRLPFSFVTSPSGEEQKTVNFIDCRDNGHPILRKWNRSRAAEYLQRGWFDRNLGDDLASIREDVFIKLNNLLQGAEE